MNQKQTRISGKDAAQKAFHNARYGHRRWIVWTGRDEITYADRCTPVTVKDAMLAVGTTHTPERRWTLVDGQGGMCGSWRIGLNLIAQMRYGF